MHIPSDDDDGFDACAVDRGEDLLVKRLKLKIRQHQFSMFESLVVVLPDNLLSGIMDIHIFVLTHSCSPSSYTAEH